MRGSQDRSDPHGNVIRPFDPNLTGKFDYDGRAKIQKGLPANFGGVVLPSSLKSPLHRVYSPETIHLEGYSQFPKPVSNPYTNEKALITKDMVARQRSREAMNQFYSNRNSISSKWNKKLVANLESPGHLRNNVGASFLTSPVNYSQQQPVVDIMQSQKEKLMQDLEKYKPKAEVEFGKKKKATAQGARVT